MNRIRVVIIDDEKAAREELKQALGSYPDFEVIGEAEDADAAKQLIEKVRPDLMFLDIQMPEKSGFDLLNELAHHPKLIFVTAFDEYAVKAFEADAFDYLLKPVREERFAKAIEKFQKAWLNTKFNNEANNIDQNLFIRDGEHLYIFKMKEISMIESADDYSRVYFNGNKAMIRRSLKQWETVLDENIFIRINRNELININYIQQIENTKTGRLKVQMKSGRESEVSARQSRQFRRMNHL